MNYILETNHLSKQSGNTYRVNGSFHGCSRELCLRLSRAERSGQEHHAQDDSRADSSESGQHQTLWNGYEFRQPAVDSKANGESH